MAILKLKDELRSSLYYSKYIYKALFNEPGLFYSRYANTLEEFSNRIKLAKDHAKRYTYSLRHIDRDEYWDSMDMDLISKFMLWKEKHKENVTIRLERDSASVFFNEIEVVNDLDEFIPIIRLSKIDLRATGKLFFKRPPKYNYRMYFKQNIYKFSDELDEFIVAHAGNADIYFSRSLLRTNDHNIYLPSRLPYYYFNCRGFVDYNNESTLTLLHMYFSGAIGKVYKLEKEPD